jgi:PmbA protein
VHKLLAQARQISDKSEIYTSESITNIVSFENGKLKNIKTNIQQGCSLRIIKNNILGFSYTKHLNRRKALLENCRASLKGKVGASFDFPQTKKQKKLRTYSTSLERLSNRTLVDECQRISDLVRSKVTGQFNITAATSIEKLRIMNSAGADIKMRNSEYMIALAIVYPNSYAAVRRIFRTRGFKKPPDRDLMMLVDLYNRSAKVVSVPGQKMKVLFMPESMHTLTWRLQSGTSGAAVYEKQSPISSKIGKKIFSEKLTVYNDPLDDSLPGARAVDDEAQTCTYFPIIEKGILVNFYNDLFYAEKNKVKPTGHGFKGARWSGETIALKPMPALRHLHIKPGKLSLSDLIKNMDEGIIISGALGAHSGNIVNGDYSIGLSPGLFVKNGDIIGRAIDVMVAGNIYETMQKVIAIENREYPTLNGIFPSVLFDDVIVAAPK